MTAFEKLIHEVNKDEVDRKGFAYKRKPIFKIGDDSINKLYNNYFNKINVEDTSYTFSYNSEDLEQLLVILRCYFKLWIECNPEKITIYKHFPKKFEIIKDVTKENHWFTPEVFKKGSVLYYSESNYGTANLLNGIPLSKSLNPVEGTNIIPSTQINYEFIKPIEY